MSLKANLNKKSVNFFSCTKGFNPRNRGFIEQENVFLTKCYSPRLISICNKWEMSTTEKTERQCE